MWQNGWFSKRKWSSVWAERQCTFLKGDSEAKEWNLWCDAYNTGHMTSGLGLYASSAAYSLKISTIHYGIAHVFDGLTNTFFKYVSTCSLVFTVSKIHYFRIKFLKSKKKKKKSVNERYFSLKFIYKRSLA